MNHPEAHEQRALFLWAWATRQKYPELGRMRSSLNGAHLKGGGKQWNQLEALGAKKGALDVHLPVARHGYHSLWIEFKAPGRSKNLSKEQAEEIEQLRADGNRVEVFDNWLDASGLLAWYLTPAGR